MSTTGKAQILSPQDLDWQKVIYLDQNYFERPWSQKDWLELNPDHHCVASWKKENQLIGFALFQVAPQDEMAHLLKIFLLKEFRGTGEASAFFNSLVGFLKLKSLSRIYLEVETPNLAAIGFYQKMGFVPLRTMKGFYSDGTDGQSMELTL